MEKTVLQTGAKIVFLYDNELTEGNVESFDSLRGTYKVRISGGRLVSVPSDECYTEERIDEIAKERESKQVSEPSEPSEQNPKFSFSDVFDKAKKILVVVAVVGVIIAIALNPKKEETKEIPKPKTEAETLYERLNHLNAEDAKEWGACGRQEARKKEKEEILKRLNSLR